VPYAPDFVVNAGGVIQGLVSLRLGVRAAEADIHARVEAIEGRVEGLLREARERDLPPADVAVARALARVAAAKGQDPRASFR
jgi:glutamate dehydrogenase/leucine dehydrogenase